jgi:general secretion pathway protein L
MATLILTLPSVQSNSAPEYDYVLTRDGQQQDAHGRVVATLLPQPGVRGAETVAVVPSQSLSWHRVTLPKRTADALLSSRADGVRVRAVLAGLLEEYLLDEPEQLHFALFSGDVTAGDQGQQVWVAVCDRRWLQVALTALETAGHAASRIVAEHAPLHRTADLEVRISTDLDPAQVVLVAATGVTVMPLCASAVSVARHMAANAAMDIQSEPSVLALAEDAFGTAVATQTRAQRMLLAAQSGWNLGQLEFSASRGARLTKTLTTQWQALLYTAQWRPVRWGVIALVLVQVFSLNAMAWKEKSLLDARRGALRSILLETFPQTTVVVDSPLQMQREVAVLARSRGADTNTDVMAIFATIGSVAGIAIELKAIDIVAGEVRLTAAGVSEKDLSRLNDALISQGFMARQSDGQIAIQRQGSR